MYVGSDPALASQPPIPASRSEGWQDRYRDEFQAWQQRRRDAVDQARYGCARETHESPTATFWFGYSNDFIACMKAREWSRSGVSNPL